MELARTEDQTRSLVSITADSDSSLRKRDKYPLANGEANRPPGVGGKGAEAPCSLEGEVARLIVNEEQLLPLLARVDPDELSAL